MALAASACSSGGSGPSKNPDAGADTSTPETGGRGSGGRDAGTHPTGGSGGETNQSGGASNGGTENGGAGNGGTQNGGAGNGGAGGAQSGGRGGAGGRGGVDAGNGGVDAGGCGVCPSGVCLPDGGCAECGVDADCTAPRPRCDVTKNACVACLPGDGDNCPDGNYCDGDDHACKTGCKNDASCGAGVCTTAHVCADCNPAAAIDRCAANKHCTASGDCVAGCKTDGSDCASGTCTVDHECTNCVTDSECLPGHLCSTGNCLPNCGHDNEPCVDPRTCCGDRCADLARDTRSCGACGTTCSTVQFCGIAGCSDGIISKVCDSAAATFLKDGLDIDDAQDARLNDGFLAGCAHKPTVRVVTQDQADTVNGKTGQPYVGSGDMQVIVGGPYGQLLIRYLENTGATRIYNSFDSNGAQFHLRGADGGAGTVVVDGLSAQITAHHDWFLIESVVDPTSGTLMFAVDGFSSIGTVAATYYFLNVMLPSLPTYDQSYYIYEWTDTDNDGVPGAGDTFTMVTSGR